MREVSSSKLSRVFIISAAICWFLATCLGAFGAHALKSRISMGMLAVYQVGVNYQKAFHLIVIIPLRSIKLTNRMKKIWRKKFKFVC